MKLKHIYAVLLVLFLIGCSNDNVIPPEIEPEPEEPLPPIVNEYLYEFDLDLNNYEKIFTLSYYPQTIDDEKYIFIEHELLNESDKVQTLEITVTILSKSTIPGNPQIFEKDHTSNLSDKDTFDDLYKMPMFQVFYGIKIKSVIGKVSTNTNINKEVEESPLIYNQLLGEIDSISDFEKLHIETKINYGNNTSTMDTSLSNDPFQISTIVDNKTGIVIEEKDGLLYQYEISEFAYIRRHRLIGIYDSLADVDGVDDVEISEFDPSWIYTYENGVYHIKTDLSQFLMISIKDQDVIDNLLGLVGNKEVVMTLKMTKDKIKLVVNTEIDKETFKVEITYNFNVEKRIDLSKIIKNAPSSPLLVEDLTNFDKPLYNQMVLAGEQNFYIAEFEAGVYVFNNNEDLNIIFGHPDYTAVDMKKSPNYNFQTTYNNIYDLKAGTYIIQVSNKYYSNKTYSLNFINLSKEYETIVDAKNPEVIEIGQYKLTLEGKYDFVVASYNSPKGEILKLEGDKAFLGKVSILEGDNSSNTTNVITIDNDHYIYVDQGVTKLLFEPDSTMTVTEVNFNVSTYGSLQLENGLLSNEYSDDYDIVFNNIHANYEFILNETKNIKFSIIYDLITTMPSNGFNYIIEKLDENGVWRFERSFYMKNETTINLEEGTYLIRINGQKSFKIKGEVLS